MTKGFGYFGGALGEVSARLLVRLGVLLLSRLRPGDLLEDLGRPCLGLLEVEGVAVPALGDLAEDVRGGVVAGKGVRLSKACNSCSADGILRLGAFVDSCSVLGRRCCGSGRRLPPRGMCFSETESNPRS